MYKVRQAYRDWGVAAFLTLAVFGCFVALALTPDRSTYPDINLSSKDLVRLQADYTSGSQIVNRGRLVGRISGQLLLRNQDDDLVYIPYAASTEVQGLTGGSVDKLSLGSLVAVTRPVGAGPATLIRGLE